MSIEFQIKATNNLESGDIMSITLPTPIQYTLQSKCMGSSYWVSGDLACTFSDDRQTAAITLNVAGQRILEEEEVIEEDGFLKEQKTTKSTKRRL